MLSKPVEKKKPVTIQMLNLMFDNMFIEGNLKNQRTIYTCLISYAGFLRSEELLHIRRRDIRISDKYVFVFGVQ